MDLGLTGQSVAVVGASSGIGAATARSLAAEGARVLLIARGEQKLRLVAEDLPGTGHVVLEADVCEEDAGEKIVQCAVAKHGSLDAIVYCAGTSAPTDIEEIPQEHWQLQMQLNVLGLERLLKAAAAPLSESKGRFVVIASSSAKRPSQRNVAYSVTKSAQLALAKAWADHLAPRGVRVNSLAPGPIDSELWMDPGGIADQIALQTGKSRDEVLAQTQAQVPLRRFGTPQEIADAACLLASPRAGFATGAAWSIDGGSVQSFL